MKLIGNYWLGVLLYVILTVIIADIIRMILLRVPQHDKRKLRSRRRTFVTAGTCYKSGIAAVVWGAANDRCGAGRRYDVTVDKAAAAWTL